MSRSIDRPEGRGPSARPRSVRPPASRPKHPPGVESAWDWSDRVRLGPEPKRRAADSWPAWTDEGVWTLNAEGGDL